MNLVDFHSHVLPAMDDGARDDAQSMDMVNDLIRQGVNKIVCTPHFYPYEESKEEYISRRDESFIRLKSLYIGVEGIELIKGTEVYCSEMLEFTNDFTGLCIDDTSTILIELPTTGTISKRILKILSELSERHLLTPVIAHIDRYPEFKFAPVYNVRKLKRLGCKIQVNCDAVIDRKSSRMVQRLLRNNLVDVLGSDCHEPGRRPPRMQEACESIAQRFGENRVKQLMDNANVLISRSGKSAKTGIIY